MRKWIEGKGQLIMWADSATRLLKMKEGEWDEVMELGSNMKGMLPPDWALEFSGGKVQEL